MYKQLFIKKLISLLLLQLFAFSVTPKQWIHKIVFKHKDVYTICTDGNTKAHLHETGYHCELDTVTILSPFVCTVTAIETTKLPAHSVYCLESVHPFHSTFLLYSDFRGPPSIA